MKHAALIPVASEHLCFFTHLEMHIVPLAKVSFPNEVQSFVKIYVDLVLQCANLFIVAPC